MQNNGKLIFENDGQNRGVKRKEGDGRGGGEI